MQRGLSLFVDGLEMSRDSGGIGVTNYLAAPQEENLSIGRNIGVGAPNFASLYISSLAIFREELSAALAFDIYKYYVTDGECELYTYFNKVSHQKSTKLRPVRIMGNISYLRNQLVFQHKSQFVGCLQKMVFIKLLELNVQATFH